MKFDKEANFLGYFTEGTNKIFIKEFEHINEGNDSFNFTFTTHKNKLFVNERYFLHEENGSVDYRFKIKLENDPDAIFFYPFRKIRQKLNVEDYIKLNKQRMVCIMEFKNFYDGIGENSFNIYTSIGFIFPLIYLSGWVYIVINNLFKFFA